jgi:hypothetical protein
MTAAIFLGLRIVLAVALYLFLWRVLQTLWREVESHGVLLAAHIKPGIQVDAKMENGAEHHYRFKQTEVVIGRGLHCDISLSDEALSASHARLSYHHGQWWLEDMESTNGTFLNTHRIVVPTVLVTGDQFRCGNTLFSLRVDLADGRISQGIQNEIGGST